MDTLKFGKAVGILKIGTVWPPPADLISKHLTHAERVLFVEEVDPFLEDLVKDAEKLAGVSKNSHLFRVRHLILS